VLVDGAREPAPDGADERISRTTQANWAAAVALLLLGLALLWQAGLWRAMETVVSAHLMNLVTSAHATAYATTNTIVLQKGGKSIAAFLLSGECSVAYFLAFLALVAAPMALLPRVGWIRAVVASIAAGMLIEVANLVRLAGIGMAVVDIGTNNGYTLAHTYLGPFVMFIVTAVAGVIFVGSMFYRRGWTKSPS